MLRALEQAAIEHQHATDDRVVWLGRLDLLMLVLNLSVLLLIALTVFRPMMRRVRDKVEELAATNAALEARTDDLELARRTALGHAAEAERSEREVAVKNRELETMLYVISHDLREPLRAVEQFSQLVDSRYSERIDDKGRDFLRRVIKAATRMRTLLDDILDLSRARRLQPAEEPIPGGEIAREVVERLAARIEETGAVVAVASDLPDICADRTWATAALFNLLSNGLKFTRNGTAPEVSIDGYREHGNGADVTGFIVRDRGPGVAPEHVQRIFNLFQRAVGRDIDGTGAGLAIVATVAERHGGQAWVRAREGGGSEFFLTFAHAPSQSTPGAIT